MSDLVSGEWLDSNRAQWDERVPLHVASEFYDQSALRAGTGILYPVEETELAELFPEGLSGKRILHLQCHFGADTLVLAQRGATVVGVDFSKPAVQQARALAVEVGLAERSRFIEANVYELRHMLPEPESFDIIYTTWGTIGWLPDVQEWAKLVAWYLKPGGQLYYADGHPTAWVFGDGDGELPAFEVPYGTESPLEFDDGATYVDESAATTHTKTFEWMHPLSSTVTALLDAGLHLDFLHEHYAVPYRMFEGLELGGDRMYRWPGKKWLPLAMSIAATRR